MKTTKPEFEVPEAAIRAYDRAVMDEVTMSAMGMSLPTNIEERVRAIATPVVVALLRGKADSLYCDRDAQVLLNLADELEAGA